MRDILKRLVVLLFCCLVAAGWCDPDNPPNHPEDETGSIPVASPTPTPGGLTTNAELAMRYERDLNSPFKTDRLRYRARVGWQYQSHDWLFDVHLRSGNPYFPNSSWTTIDKNQVDGRWADEVYAKYRPHTAPGWEFEAGEFPRPWHTNPVYSGFIWSNLIKPGGVNIAYNSPDQRWWLDISPWFAMPIDVGHVGDFRVWAVHGGAGWGRYDTQRLEVSCAIMRFDYDLAALTTLLGRNVGNSVVTMGKTPVGFGSTYDIIDPKMDWYFHRGKIPMAISFEYWDNLGQTTPGVKVNGKTGYQYGIVVGKTQWPHKISARIDFVHVGQDAVFTPVAQADYAVQTNFDGIYANLAVPLSPHLTTVFVLEHTDPSAVQKLQNRTSIDLSYQL